MSAVARTAAVHVPFLDVTAGVDEEIHDRILAGVRRLLATGAFTNGPEVARFEAAFARYCGAAECVGVASGLDAIRLTLLAAGLRPGDEVIVPANTFLATFEAVTQAGGVPVPADVSERDYNLDPAAAEAAVSPRTSFLLPVHLYGQMADMRALSTLAARAGLRLLEDACQAPGAERDGIRAGTVGVGGAFSFYPAKNLGAIGDAGAVVTNDPSLAGEVRALREHGQREKYEHHRIGYTARLDTIQALALLAKLPLLDGWNEERSRVAVAYGEGLTGVGDLILPPVPPASAPVWHLYVVRTSRRDELGRFLAGRGIGTGRHYPEPPHLSRAYAHLGYPRGSFPAAEALAEELLSLPMFPGITQSQIDAVVASVRDFYRE
jgi:dTDP-4-amino-4,6-dideoxygalactose transaminase